MPESHQIRLSGTDGAVGCAADRTILDACLEAGLQMPYNCRSGECAECVATVVRGEVEELPGADPAVFTDRDREAGRILTCMCFPRSDLELETVLRDGIAAPKIERVHCMVERLEWHGPNIAGIELQAPWPIAYRPGQYFDWQIDGIEPDRSFSVANAPGPSGAGENLGFHVRYYPGGKVSEHVKAHLGVGHSIEIEGPYGHFGLTDNDWRPALMIAGGTGMAPMRAVLEAAIASSDPRPMRYFYGTRTQEDLYCQADMAAWSGRKDNFAFIPALSHEPAESGWAGARGLVTDVLAEQIGDAFGAEAYLCGPPPMIDAAIRVLLDAGLAEEDIRYDKFTPARDG